MTNMHLEKHLLPATLAALLAACGAAVAQPAPAPAPVKERPIPQVVKKDGRYALMVDGAPYLMLGAQAHNSSGWLRIPGDGERDSGMNVKSVPGRR